MSRFISLFSFIASIYFVYRFRFRMFNLILGQRWVRKMLVALAMQIPFVRQKLMSGMMVSTSR